MTEQTLLLWVCVHVHVYVCASLPQLNICLCSDRNIGPLAPQMEALFSFSARFCLLSTKQTLHIFASYCHDYHLKLRTQTRTHTNTHTHVHPYEHARRFVPEHTYAKLTKQTVCDPLKSFSKWVQVTFIPNTHTCAHSFYFTQSIFSQSRFAYLFWCCLLFMSQIARCDPLALFILSLLKEALILLFLQQMGTGFLIAMES